MKSLALTICLLLLYAVTPAQAVTFTTIDFPGAILTSVNGINDNGDMVGNYDTTQVHGFLLSGGVFTSIDFPGTGVSTWCEGINDNGDIVGWYVAPGDVEPHAFLMQGGVFTALDFPGAITTTAWGINNAGEIVGEYSTGAGIRGFTYQSGVYTDVTVPNATSTQLRGINNVGDIVGRFANQNGTNHGLILSNGIQHFLNVPGAIATYANGVNDRKHVVGYQDLIIGDSGFSFFRGAYGAISKAGSNDVKALGINKNLDIVGEYTDHQSVTHGFVRTP